MGDNWSTPDLLFEKLHDEFQFNLDACASEWNHKCQNYYTEKDDSLTRDWEGMVWMNPPYSKCGMWIKKAWEECQKGSTIVCLIPARIETNWFHDYCIEYEIRFIKGRVHFSDEDEKTGRPRFGNILVIMRPIVFDSGNRSVIQPAGLKIN